MVPLRGAGGWVEEEVLENEVNKELFYAIPDRLCRDY